jgi:hypothetical protein
VGVSNFGLKIGGLTRTLVLGGVVAAAALLPLFGDPTGAAVSHAEWARYLLRGLDLLDPAVRVGDQASVAFGILSGRDSLSFRGDKYVSARGVEAVNDGGARRVRSVAGIGEVSYALAVARPGEYRLRLRMSGDPGTPAEAEVSAGDAAPKQTFPVVPGPAPGWVDVGALKLTRGGYTASILLPQGAEIEQLEMAPPCVNAIEPRGGWRAVALTSTSDAALTALRAVDLESELPPADVPVEMTGADFRVEADSSAVLQASGGLETSLRASPGGTRAVVMAKLPEPGLYVLSYFGTNGAGQLWGVDRCRRAVLCPDEAAARWHTVLSADFTAGLHSFDVLLAPGAVIDRVRFERKKDGRADYLATANRLGLDLGADDAPLTRGQAGEAWRWVAAHRTPKEAQCGEVVIPETLVARSTEVGPGGAFAALPPPSFPNPAPFNAPPVLPPRQDLSPVAP